MPGLDSSTSQVTLSLSLHGYFAGMPEGPVRNHAVDFYRVSGVVLIVLGHWLAGSVTYQRRIFRPAEPAGRSAVDAVVNVDLPGRANLLPGRRLRRCGVMDPSASQRGNLAPGLVAPSTCPRAGAFDRVRLADIGSCRDVREARGCSGSLLEYAGWAVAMHLWFLAVYLMVVSLTPIAIAVQRRWGLLVPAALGIGVAAVEGAVSWSATSPIWVG